MNVGFSTCGGDWEARWQAGDTPWDLGAAPPSLVAAIDSVGEAPQRVFVPGAGQGHDAVAWARAGHAVTAIDIAPTAIEAATALARAAGVSATMEVADLFALPSAWDATFDLVWEQTCFCAIPPERRPDYADVAARLLRPGGRLLGVLWNVGTPEGPPYDVTREDIQAAFGDRFEIVAMKDVAPWTRVRWHEFTVELLRRDG